ncbi:MAG: N-acetylmuramoyl-L-alanine amidase [Eubacterium sp.]|nr:N-acetylmuramoyl-L-alanine amidase [Eubacterium sp.]
MESISSGRTAKEAEEKESVRTESISLAQDIETISTLSTGEGADGGNENGNTNVSAVTSSEAKEEESLVSASSDREPGPLVCIDPGHSNLAGVLGRVPLGPGSSETKPGDVLGTKGAATEVPEYELTLQVSKLLKAELEARGYRVIMTREENDVTVDLVRRAEIANEAGADIMVRIHANGSDNSSAAGALGICITENNPFVAKNYVESRKLTEDVLNSYCETTNLKNTGIWETDSMATSNWAQMPTTLLELGFMTNPDEDRRMEEADFQKLMADGIADGIERYFG